MKKPLTLFCLLCCAWAAQAQMWNGQDTLYGNEWIDFSKTYYKIRVADDGIYRLNFQSLTAANFPVADVPASQLRLYREGREVPLFTSTESAFGSGDYLEFYGEKTGAPSTLTSLAMWPPSRSIPCTACSTTRPPTT